MEAINNAPIGVIDSGIGGLTVANAVRSLLPAETIFYFGDTAHLPYGDKSESAILSYVQHIAEFLFNKGCKLVVIACNSASASAYNALLSLYGNERVIDVIEPVVNSVVNGGHTKLGVIGTKRTISSRVYLNALTKKMSEDVVSLETPLLASMIEEGFIQNKISQAIISNYLGHKNLHGIDALILACTHYPLIRDEIQQTIGFETAIYDSTIPVAKAVKQNLLSRNLLSDKKGVDQFWVSDYTTSFEQTAKLFFGEAVSLQKSDLFKRPSDA